MKPLKILAALLLLAATQATAWAADPEPTKDQVIVDIQHGWQAPSFSPSGIPSADSIAMDLSGDAPVFTSYTNGKRATFSKYIHLLVDMELYPIMKLKYSGSNIEAKDSLTCIWIGLADHDPKGRPQVSENQHIFPLIDFDKLTFDGQSH